MASNEFNVLSVEDKEKINGLIADGLEVFNAPVNCLCSNCRLVPVFHYIFSCSHLYCRPCYQLYAKEKRSCRKCRRQVDNSARQDKAIEQTIYNLKTECPNRGYGCPEKVTVRSLLEHIGSCKFSLANMLPQLVVPKLEHDVTEKNIDNNCENLVEQFETRLNETTAIFNQNLQGTNEELTKKLETATCSLTRKFESSTAELNEKINGIMLLLQNRQPEMNNQKVDDIKKSVENIDAKLIDQKRYIDDKISASNLNITTFKHSSLEDQEEASRCINQKIAKCDSKLLELTHKLDTSSFSLDKKLETMKDELVEKMSQDFLQIQNRSSDFNQKMRDDLKNSVQKIDANLLAHKRYTDEKLSTNNQVIDTVRQTTILKHEDATRCVEQKNAEFNQKLQETKKELSDQLEKLSRDLTSKFQTVTTEINDRMSSVSQLILDKQSNGSQKDIEDARRTAEAIDAKLFDQKRNMDEKISELTLTMSAFKNSSLTDQEDANRCMEQKIAKCNLTLQELKTELTTNLETVSASLTNNLHTMIDNQMEKMTKDYLHNWNHSSEENQRNTDEINNKMVEFIDTKLLQLKSYTDEKVITITNTSLTDKEEINRTIKQYIDESNQSLQHTINDLTVKLDDSLIEQNKKLEAIRNELSETMRSALLEFKNSQTETATPSKDDIKNLVELIDEKNIGQTKYTDEQISACNLIIASSKNLTLANQEESSRLINQKIVEWEQKLQETKTYFIDQLKESSTSLASNFHSSILEMNEKKDGISGIPKLNESETKNNTDVDDIKKTIEHVDAKLADQMRSVEDKISAINNAMDTQRNASNDTNQFDQSLQILKDTKKELMDSHSELSLNLDKKLEMAIGELNGKMENMLLKNDQLEINQSDMNEIKKTVDTFDSRLKDQMGYIEKTFSENNIKIDDLRNVALTDKEKTSNAIKQLIIECDQKLRESHEEFTEKLDSLSSTMNNKIETITGGSNEKTSQDLPPPQNNSSSELNQSNADDIKKAIDTINAKLLDQKVYIDDHISAHNQMITTFKNSTLTDQEEENRYINQKIMECDNKIAAVEKTLNNLNKDSKMSVDAQKQTKDNSMVTLEPKNGVLIWEIEGYSKIKEMIGLGTIGSLDLYSETFYSSDYGHRMKMKAKFQKDQLGVYLQFVPGPNDTYLPKVFHHRKTFFLLSQSDRNDKTHVVNSNEPRFRDGLAEKWMTGQSGYNDFCKYSTIEGNNREIYLKNDKIILKVLVESVEQLTKQPASNNGTLIWKVLNYERTKQESLDKTHEMLVSDSFYSDTHGYRMQCYLIFVERQLNIWLYFLRGEFDDALPDVFAHKVTFLMLSQVGGGNEISLGKQAILDPKEIGDAKAKEKMNAYGCNAAVFLYSTFENTPMLLNDSVVFKVVVEHL